MASELNSLLLCRNLRPSSHAAGRTLSRWVSRLHEPKRAISSAFCLPLILRPRSFSSTSRQYDADGVNAIPDSMYLNLARRYAPSIVHELI